MHTRATVAPGPAVSSTNREHMGLFSLRGSDLRMVSTMSAGINLRDRAEIVIRRQTRTLSLNLLHMPHYFCG